MGIFGDGDRGRRGRVAAKAYNAAASEILQVLCDRCHAAWAKVEVITNAGPVFFCQHHHKKYRNSIIAAGHQIRAMLGPRSLRRVSSAEPSPHPCHWSITVTPVSAVSGWSARRMNRHSPTISADSSGMATSAS